MDVQQRYSPVVVGVNATVSLTATGLGGFLAITDGTVTVVDQKGVTIITAFPVTEGNWYPMPFFLGGPALNATFTTAGGASGTIGVW